MLGASESAYDLRFRFLGVPVRIHPMFWLVSAVLGWQDKHLEMVALWVACVLVSILVHEYGHALAAKAFDGSPSIVLWGLGGLCYSQADRQTPRQRMLVILSGPGAGFVLLGVVLVVTSLLFQITPAEHLDAVLAFFGLPRGFGGAGARFAEMLPSEGARRFAVTTYGFLIEINLLWGLVNLLPLWPLDGGQATQIILSYFDRSRGARWGHIVSLLVAGGLAVMAVAWTNDMFLTLFFAYFAVVNFQVLQTLHQAHSMGIYQEDEWWRR